MAPVIVILGAQNGLLVPLIAVHLFVFYFGSPAEDAGVSFAWTIDAVQVELERPPKELMFIPAIILLGLVAFGQLRRRTPEEASVT